MNVSSLKQLLKTDAGIEALECRASVQLIIGTENDQGGVTEKIGVSA